MNVSAAIVASGNVSSRLPNSIAVFSGVCPGERAATTLVWVHRGQSGQPSPDELSRTAAPVQMRTAFAITDASANPRTEPRVGRSTGAVSRAVTRRTPEAATCASFQSNLMRRTRAGSRPAPSRHPGGPLAAAELRPGEFACRAQLAAGDGVRGETVAAAEMRGQRVDDLGPRQPGLPPQRVDALGRAPDPLARQLLPPDPQHPRHRVRVDVVG